MSKEIRANKKEKHKEVVIFSCYEETVRGASSLRNWVKKTNNWVEIFLTFLWSFTKKALTLCHWSSVSTMQNILYGRNASWFWWIKSFERSMNFNIFLSSSKSHSSENILFLFTTTKCCQKPQSCQSFFEWSRILINLCDGARCTFCWFISRAAMIIYKVNGLKKNNPK